MLDVPCPACRTTPTLRVSCGSPANRTRVPFGSEYHYLLVEPRSGTPAASCPRCLAPRGGYHHVGCPIDECPVCQNSAARCACSAKRARALLA